MYNNGNNLCIDLFMFPTWKENPLFTAMLFLVSLALFVYLGEKSFETMQITKHLDRPTPLEHTFIVEGIGKSMMVPDVAAMTFSISSTDITVADAQKQNSAKMNAMTEKIKATGIADADLQTKDYSAYEKTEWNPQKQISVSVGWVVSQSLEVKIRDSKNISTVVEIAGQNGSTSISGPSFTVDDPLKYEAIAREKGLADAKQKAEFIAKSLNLSIDRAIGYTEYQESAQGPIPYMSEKMGGAASSAPNISIGTQELKLHTTVTYLLKQ